MYFRFQYASLLANSESLEDCAESISHLQELVTNPLLRKDCLHSLTSGLSRLQKYDLALTYCEELYREEPDNNQVHKSMISFTFMFNFVWLGIQIQSLHSAILTSKRKREFDQHMGTALGTAAIVFTAAVGFTLFALRRNKRK